MNAQNNSDNQLANCDLVEDRTRFVEISHRIAIHLRNHRNPPQHLVEQQRELIRHFAALSQVR